MQTLMTVLVLGLCFAALGVGLLLANKVLRKGCSDNPEGCACKRAGRDPNECMNE